MKTTKTEDFNYLLHRAARRAERHKTAEGFKCNCHEPGCETLHQIRKDIFRTTSVFTQSDLKDLSEVPIESGMNPLYNILAAYAEFDTEIGYTQGMNYLAALIYIAVGDEVMAFALLTKVMYDLKWREIYADKLIKLMSLTKKIKYWLLREHKTIAVHLDAC